MEMRKRVILFAAVIAIGFGSGVIAGIILNYSSRINKPDNTTTETTLAYTVTPTPTLSPTPSTFPYAPPNDPFFNKQWNLNNPRTGINIREAWKLAGRNELIVAVIDKGFNPEHEDLKGQFWVNHDEIAGNGIDDDQNGYIDDRRGYDFSNDSYDVTNNALHGVWTSGIIAAKANNETGIAGVCSECKIMPLVVETEAVGESEARTIQAGENLAEALQYAYDNGARVVSMSFTLRHTKKLQDKINQLYGKGLVMVAAAGNTNSDGSGAYPSNYPAREKNVIGVASINKDGSRSAISNYGEWVNIAAPASKVPLVNSGKGDATFTGPLKDFYNGDPYALSRIDGGTSIATPHVAGVAALLLSCNPDLSAKEVTDILLKNVTPHLQTKYKLGSGILNAGKALEQCK